MYRIERTDAGSAFQNCTGIKELILEEGIGTINGGAFMGCGSLEEVTLPSTLTSIGSSIFADCEKLKKIIFAEGMTVIPSSALSGCKTVEEVVIPNTVTEIGASAFDDCYMLKKIELPKGLKKISNYAFSECNALTEVTIPDSVTTLGTGAFEKCQSLKSVKFGAGLESIGASAFMSCTALKSTEFGSSLKSIGASAFLDCSALESIEFGSGLKSIGNAAFQECTALESLTIPGNVTTMDSYAFYRCAGLKELTLKEGITTIGVGTFAECESLEEVTLPSTLTSTESNIFTNCEKLKKVIFAEGMTAIPSQALYGCKTVEEAVIPDTVTEIGASAFDDCYMLNKIDLPKGLKKISNYAFSECSSLTDVTIPDSVTTLGTGAFEKCQSLKAVKIGFSVESVGDYAFMYCDSLEEITIPASVTSISSCAFYGCSDFVIYCEAGSYAEKFAQDHEIPYFDIIINKDDIYEGESDFYYTVKEYRRGYSAYDTVMNVVLSAEQADSAGLLIACTDADRKTTKEIPMEYDVEEGCYRAAFEITEGMKSIDALTARLTENGVTSAVVFEDSYWHSMPLKVESTITAEFGDNIGEYAGMTLKLFEDSGRLVSRQVLGNADRIVFHGLADDKTYKAVVYGGDLEFFRAEDISVTAGRDTVVDLKEMALPASIQIKFECDGEEVNDEGMKVSFYDKTEGKNRLLPAGLSVDHLAAGDTIGYSLTMSRSCAVLYEKNTDVSEVTLSPGENIVTIQLEKIPEIEYQGSVTDGETGNPVFNVSVTVIQLLNDQYTQTYSVRTDRDGRFSLTVKDVDSKIVLSKNAYASQTLEAERGSLPTEILLMPEGGKIKFNIGYQKSVKETQLESTILYSEKPNQIVIENTTKGIGVAAGQSSYPILYVDEKTLAADDEITVTLRKAGYADLQIDTSVNQFGNVEVKGTMKELGGVMLSFVRADGGTDPVHAVIFDSEGKKIRYIGTVENQDIFNGLQSGTYSIAAADKDENINMHLMLSELELSDMNYAITQVEVEDGLISCPDLLTIPGISDTQSILNGETRLTGATTALIGDTVWLSCEFGFDPAYDDVAKKISITIPDGTKVVNNGVSLNGTLMEYESADGRISVSAEESGILKIGLKILSDISVGRLDLVSTVDYELGGKTYSEMLGSMEIDVNSITLVVPEQTNAEVIVARGIAPGSSKVQIYDNGVLAAETESNRYGIYRTEISLDTSRKYVVHNLYAVSGESVSETAELQYGINHPTVIDFNMYHDAHFEGGTEINFNTTKEVGYFVGYMWPIKPFDFWLKFDDNYGVSDVSVHIEFTNGDSVDVPLELNEETDYFEGSITLSDSTVPKSFSVLYLPVTYYDTEEEADDSEEINIFEDASVSVITKYEDEEGFRAEYRANLKDFEDQEALCYIEYSEQVEFEPSDEYVQMEYEGRKAYAKPVSTYIETANGLYDTVEMYIENADGTYSYLQEGIGFERESQEVTLASNTSKKKLTAKERKQYEQDVEDFKSNFNVKVTDDNRGEIIYKLNTFINTCKKEPELRDEIMMLETEYELILLMHNTKATYVMVDQMESSISMFSDLIEKNYVNIITDKAADKFMNQIEKQTDSAINKSLQNLLNDIKNNKKLWKKIKELYKEEKMADTKMIMDPSGYVYETVPENRISGVTATVYFENDLGQMEWWDAEEYNQVNPQLTDENGRYAWDVPEGLWQVRYEKKGYITTLSEKLPVPPPQLEVNVEMVSELPADISEIKGGSDRVELVFDRYLDVETITKGDFSLTSQEKEIPFDIELEDVRRRTDGSDIVKAVTLIPDRSLSDGEYIVKISDNIATYAGTNLDAIKMTFYVSGGQIDLEECRNIVFDAASSTATITSGKDYDDAVVFFAAYSRGKLVSLDLVDKDLTAGENTAVSEKLSVDGADTVKVMVCENKNSLTPLFNVCVMHLEK